jgi:hypothetical protein
MEEYIFPLLRDVISSAVIVTAGLTVSMKAVPV